MVTNKRKLSIIFAICYLAYSSIYIARLNFSIASPMLTTMGIVNKAQIGLIGSVFSIIYAMGKLPSGYLGDRVSAKVMIVGGLAITSLSNIFIGFMPVYWAILIFWGINGLGQSIIWGPMLRSVTNRVEPEQLARNSYLLVSSVAFGSVMGLLISSLIMPAFGVMAVFFIPGIITLLITIVFAFTFHENTVVCTERKTPMRIRDLLRRKDFRLMILPAMAHGIIRDNINLWIIVYYVDTFGINVAAMASFIFIIPLIGFGGRMLFPFLFHLCGENENMVSVIAFCSCIIFVIPLCISGITPIVAAVCLSLISAMISIINTSVLSVFPARFVNTGNVSFMAGAMDFLTYGGSGISSVVYGIIITLFGYVSMFISWGILSVASIILLIYSIKKVDISAKSVLITMED